MIVRRLTLAALTLAASSATDVMARTTYAPIVYRQTSGTRPFIRVRLNDKTMLFMVHANAGFNAMTNHANAKASAVVDLVSEGDFGITSVGVKSTLGRATATADRFAVGGSMIRHMPIQVFEIPKIPPVDGMVGIGWLRRAKVLVDFRRDRLAIPGTGRDAAEERRRLRHAGYVAFPMTWIPSSNRYTVEAKVNGVPGRFIISTVSYVILDERFARARNVKLSDPIDTFGGPTGTTGNERETASDYTLEIDGEKLVAPRARAYDIYHYDGETRPDKLAEEIAGYLGCDFMRANGAVIDFGSGMLFVKLRKTG